MGLHSDNVVDVATSSNFRQVQTSHIHLDIDVHFEKREVSGWVALSLTSLVDGLNTVILDSYKAVKIKRVQEKESSKNSEFVEKQFAAYGTSCEVKLHEPKAKGISFVLEIEYVASEGPGVCWLEPEQTADKVRPFMYTQGQAVLNRGFFPCQDTPAFKATYSAFVQVPDGFTPVMSANNSSKGEKANMKGDKSAYFFEQTIPVQSYLVALAVGHIKSASIGPRSQVWAEPSMLARAQSEFSEDVETFLQTGEKLFGPYVWGRYDILVMPPSFPFGGMENPCLTFVTPCIVVGDKSLTDVVIHEITHSWFGNLVTNASWGEFWLNEGFTMFGQRRIEAELYGEAWMCLEAQTGQELLQRQLTNDGPEGPLTKLRVVIEEGVDPDDTYCETPYEKGFIFVCYLRSLAGGNEKFDAFLRAYVDKFKYKSIVAEDLFDFFLEYFPKLKEEGVHEKPGFEFVKTWLDAPGFPPYNPDLTAKLSLTGPADAVADMFLSSEFKDEFPNVEKWTTYQILYFLDKLAQNSPLQPDAMRKLMEMYPFLSSSPNAEIRLRWCEIVIKNDVKEKFEDIRAFLSCQGKQKYTKPLYQYMAKGSEDARLLAVKVFKETEKNLHENVIDYVKKILQEARCI